MFCNVLKTFSTAVTQNKQKSTRHWFPVDARSGIGLRQPGSAFNLVNALSRNQWLEFTSGVLLSLQLSENAYEKTFWTCEKPPLRINAALTLSQEGTEPPSIPSERLDDPSYRRTWLVGGT
jgi:hypothetical protein